MTANNPSRPTALSEGFAALAEELQATIKAHEALFTETPDSGALIILTDGEITSLSGRVTKEADRTMLDTALWPSGTLSSLTLTADDLALQNLPEILSRRPEAIPAIRTLLDDLKES